MHFPPPPGTRAVDSSLLFSVRGATAWPGGAVGSVYEVEPSGTKFSKPATIALSYGGADLGSLSPDDLLVGTAVGSSWQSLGNAVVHADSKTVASTTTHLSIFSLIAAGTAVRTWPFRVFSFPIKPSVEVFPAIEFLTMPQIPQEMNEYVMHLMQDAGQYMSGF